ncbi:MAG: cysteine hydrolase [Bradyrhizobiaceae bacterium]|nr:cysteine hydrolase [Bradyrhizobiaceae bacterium]
MHADLDPHRTALVVIDMQNCFLDPELAASSVPAAIEIIPAINRLASAVRETGGKVFWTLHTVNEGTLQDWSEWFGMFRGTPEQVRIRAKNMAVGSRGHALHPDMDKRPDDTVVMKDRFSAFLPESCDLAAQLRAGGYDTVLITGTATNVCCETSARDAMMFNFKVVMVSDATATWTDAEHNATLSNIYSIFGDVMDTDFLISCLRKNVPRNSAA